MNRLFISILTLLLFLLPSCARKTTIPDEELALIFRDAFLTNAYLYDSRLNIDSLQVYAPIFERYGYTTDDVAYTVGSFSTRKSARLSDVVEQSIRLLQEGNGHYKLETQILDSIDAIARREATERYYEDKYIEYYNLKDTLGIYLEFDSLRPGEYRISYDYLIDSLDNNRSNYRFVSWVEGAEPQGKRTLRRGLSTTYLRKRYVSDVERTIDIDTLTHKLYIHLAESYEVKRKPHITIKNLLIEYTPPTSEAIDKFFEKSLDVRIFSNDIFGIEAQDSIQLPAL